MRHQNSSQVLMVWEHQQEHTGGKQTSGSVSSSQASQHTQTCTFPRARASPAVSTYGKGLPKGSSALPHPALSDPMPQMLPSLLG